MSEDLIDWLRRQLDEDEQIALVIDVKEWTEESSWFKDMLDPLPSQRRERPDWLPMIMVEDIRHIARHDPARVLREVEALRAIIDLHEPREYVTYLKHVTYWQCGYCAGLCHSRSGLGCEQPVDALWPCDTVRLLAAIFSGRPGFREEWRPQ